jgi:ribosomal-protein-serine acetyltransferase
MTQTKNPILIDIPMPIRTPRLIIRPPMAGDGQVVYDAKVESQAELTKWMPWMKDGVGTVEETEIVTRQKTAEFILRQDMMLLAFTHAGEYIGSNGLHRFDWEFRSFEIGYWVRTSAHNKGYATEIANALTRFAFGALDARRVMICAAEFNSTSRRVIEKLGYDLEVVRKSDHLLPDGTPSGTAEYVRYNTDSLPSLDVKWG